MGIIREDIIINKAKTLSERHVQTVKEGKSIQKTDDSVVVIQREEEQQTTYYNFGRQN